MDHENNRPNRSYAIVSKDEAKAVPYPFVYVNDNGTVREVHQTERVFLETHFHPADSARPYIKDSYAQKDGWGSIGGFCHRSIIPKNIDILEAPAEDPSESIKKVFLEKQIRFAKEKGFEAIENADGTLTLRKPRSSS
jgi:hypothetical protein